jgi:hypothetical protein
MLVAVEMSDDRLADDMSAITSRPPAATCSPGSGFHMLRVKYAMPLQKHKAAGKLGRRLQQLKVFWLRCKCWLQCCKADSPAWWLD